MGLRVPAGSGGSQAPPQLLPSGVCAFVLMAERVFFFHLSPIYLHGSLQRAINSER